MKDPKNTLDAGNEGPWTEAPTRIARGPLVPCPSCKRHVFASSEATCPFCAATLPADLAQRAAPSTTQRMSRGEMFSFNARDTKRGVSGDALSAVAGGIGLQPAPAAAAEPGSNYGTGLGIGTFGHDPGSGFAMYGAPGTFGPGSEFHEPNEPHFLEPSPYNPQEDPGGGAAMYGAPADPDFHWNEPSGGESPNDMHSITGGENESYGANEHFDANGNLEESYGGSTGPEAGSNEGFDNNEFGANDSGDSMEA